MRYTTVVFDLDGTLLDTSKGILNSVRDTIAFYGLPSLNDRDLLVFMGCSIYESFQRFYPEQDADNLVAYFRKMYAERHFEEAGEYDGISELLMQLKNAGIKIGIATFKRDDLAKRLLSKYSFYRYIDVINGSDNEGCLRKPDIINKSIRALHPDKIEDVVVIGDANNDFIAAREVGVDFIGITYGYGFSESDSLLLPFQSVSNPNDLLNILNSKK